MSKDSFQSDDSMKPEMDQLVLEKEEVDLDKPNVKLQNQIETMEETILKVK